MFSIFPKLTTNHLADAAVAHHNDTRLTGNRLVKILPADYTPIHLSNNHFSKIIFQILIFIKSSLK